MLRAFQKSTIYRNPRVTEAGEKHANFGKTRMGVYSILIFIEFAGRLHKWTDDHAHFLRNLALSRSMEEAFHKEFKGMYIMVDLSMNDNEVSGL